MSRETAIEKGLDTASSTLWLIAAQAFAEQLIESVSEAAGREDWRVVLLLEAIAPALLGLALVGAARSEAVKNLGLGLVIAGASRGIQEPVKRLVEALLGGSQGAQAEGEGEPLAEAPRALPAPSALLTSALQSDALPSAPAYSYA